jgi:hypothetical protein
MNIVIHARKDAYDEGRRGAGLFVERRPAINPP